MGEGAEHKESQPLGELVVLENNHWHFRWFADLKVKEMEQQGVEAVILKWLIGSGTMNFPSHTATAQFLLPLHG